MKTTNEEIARRAAEKIKKLIPNMSNVTPASCELLGQALVNASVLDDGNPTFEKLILSAINDAAKENRKEGDANCNASVKQQAGACPAPSTEINSNAAPNVPPVSDAADQRAVVAAEKVESVLIKHGISMGFNLRDDLREAIDAARATAAEKE